MSTNPSDYGPFAPVVGYAGAIMAAGGALFLLWGGKVKSWRPPNSDLSGTERKIVFLLCSVLMVVEWYFAEPQRAGWMIGAVAATSILTLLCYLKYSSLIGIYGYHKAQPEKDNKVINILVLGGRKLLPEAEDKRKTLGVDTQGLLEGAAFNVDKLWSREDLDWVRTRVLTFFILLLVLGTSALTIASFATQVILTKRSAASVIDRQHAPGLK